LSLESGKKFGYYASLINVILPIVSLGVTVAIIFSIIATAARGITSGTTAAPTFLGFLSGGLIIFLIAIGMTAVVAYIMFMYTMYTLSNYYNEPAIFKNVLYAFILSLISGGVVAALVLGDLISVFTGFDPANTPSATTPAFTQIILLYAVVIVAALAFGIVNGFLYMRTFNKLKEKSGVDNFGTAGLLYLIGVFIPLIAWIAWIFAAMGFKNLKAAPATPPYIPYSVQPPLTTTTQTKHCPNCGTDNYGDASYCRTCGTSLQ
jgi:uncharacterized membrane protein